MKTGGSFAPRGLGNGDGLVEEDEAERTRCLFLLGVRRTGPVGELFSFLIQVD